MPVVAAEAPATPESPSESPSYRNLYILLLVCGFILRFGFVLTKKTYVYIPGNAIPFGPEVCSIASHIVRGQGFSSPFHQDTGPTAWVAPVYPYLVALVFRLFGIYSVASAIVNRGRYVDFLNVDKLEDLSRIYFKSGGNPFLGCPLTIKQEVQKVRFFFSSLLPLHPPLHLRS